MLRGCPLATAANDRYNDASAHSTAAYQTVSIGDALASGPARAQAGVAGAIVVGPADIAPHVMDANSTP
jgi:hypothetical protein